MPYNIRKRKCKQSDGDSGTYVLSYTDKKGKKHNNCHTSKKKAQGQIAAIEGPREMDEMDEVDAMMFGGGGMGSSEEEEAEDFNEVRRLVRSLVSESEEKVNEGIIYEGTLVTALQEYGQDKIVPFPDTAGNDNTVSDLGINVCGLKIACEVKLQWKDLLGAFDKRAFSSLQWDGSSFSGTIDKSNPRSDVAEIILDQIKTSDSMKTKMKILDPVTPYKALPWSLVGRGATFGYSRDVDPQNIPNDDDYIVYALIRNEESRFPLPVTDSRGIPVPTARVSAKQISSKTDRVLISPESQQRSISKKNGPNGAATSYIIVGTGDSGTAKGEIYSLGSDPLGIGAPPWNSFGNIQMRFKGGGGSSGRNFGISLDTSADSPPSGGLAFASAEEFCNIFLDSPICRGEEVPQDEPRPSRVVRGPGTIWDVEPGSRGRKFAAKGLGPKSSKAQRFKTRAAAERYAARTESLVRGMVREALILEELTGRDKDEIKRIARKEAEKIASKKEIEKIFQKKFDKELKKALGNSFFGTPGKINKFVKDEISKEIKAMFNDKITQNQIADLTKAVMKKLYRELSFSSVQIMDRIKL